MALTATSPVKKDDCKSNRSSSSVSSPKKPPSLEPPKRSNCPGVRVVGARIYDSENGKTCHQCRQKTRDFAASCKQLKKGKPCTMLFCVKCLLNRYGEKAEEVAALDGWSCPKCRGICNCSCCMKKRGQKPTGMLIHAAKATGYSSVLELLDNKGVDAVLAAATLLKSASPHRPRVSDKEVLFLKRSRLEEEGDVEQICRKNGIMKEGEVGMAEMDLNKLPMYPNKKRLHAKGKNQLKDVEEHRDAEVKAVQSESQNQLDDLIKCSHNIEDHVDAKAEPALRDGRLMKLENEVVLPKGAGLTELAGIEWEPQDVGHALQFLEFCAAFSKVLQIKKGQAESILQELAKGGDGCGLAYFHINLISIIREDREEKPLSLSVRSGDAWIREVGKLITELGSFSYELPLDWFTGGALGYDSLGSSGKLFVLNFLCNETLSTEKLRIWIDKEYANSTKRIRMAREKVVAARRKEKELKEKLKDHLAKTKVHGRGHDILVSKIREEAQKARDYLQLVPKKKKRRDAIRTEPMFLEGNGQAYWKLEGYCSNATIIRQEFENLDMTTNKDKWFIFDEDDEQLIERHIATARARQRRKLAQGAKNEN